MAEIKLKKRRGAPRKIDRENVTTEKKTSTTMQVFKRSKRIVDRLYINSDCANFHTFFDSLVKFVCENQQDFYNYLHKK